MTMMLLCRAVKRMAKTIIESLLALPQDNPRTPLETLPMPAPATQVVPQAPNGHTNGARPQLNTTDETALTVLGADIETRERVTISLDERFQGTYCIGSTGTGKTTLLLNMILSDIRAGRPLALIEPHSDLTKHVIATMPQERHKDVIYLDVTDNTASFSLNFYECPAGADLTEVAKIASFVMHVFEKVGIFDYPPEKVKFITVHFLSTKW
jgi:hypothetical protein